MSRATDRVELSAGPIHYRDVGTGEVLVFVHGILASSTLWDEVVSRLSSSARCIVPDWPLGSHREAMRPDAELSPPAIADLVIELCDRLGLETATFVGNDTGGAVCQLIAARHPERVRRLVLTPSDAYENFPPAQIFRLLNLAGRTPGGLWSMAQTMRWRWVQRLPFAFGRLSRRPIAPDVIDDWFRPVRTDREVRRDLAKLLRTLSSTYTLQAAEQLRELPAPALVIWSKDDPIFPFEHAERLAADLAHARLEVVEDSFGFVPLDQPEALAALVAAFVAETAAA